MAVSDGEFDLAESRIALLEKQVDDLIAEVSRMRNMPNMSARMADLEYRLGLIESSPVDSVVGMLLSPSTHDHTPRP
jgi:hypothetical protein